MDHKKTASMLSSRGYRLDDVNDDHTFRRWVDTTHAHGSPITYWVYGNRVDSSFMTLPRNPSGEDVGAFSTNSLRLAIHMSRFAHNASSQCN